MNKFQTEIFVKKYLLLCTIIICIVWFLIVWNNTHISRYDDSGVKQVMTGDEGYLLTLENVSCVNDNISTTNDYIEIKGWVINLNQAVNKVDIKVLLNNVETGEDYLIPTRLEERTDVTELYKEEIGNNVDWSGFSARFPYGKKINTDKYDYEIKILYQINDIEVIVNSNKTFKDFK